MVIYKTDSMTEAELKAQDDHEWNVIYTAIFIMVVVGIVIFAIHFG